MIKRTQHFLILMVILWWSVELQAIEYHRSGARSAGLGHASAAISGSEALFHNPAGISGERRFSVLCTYESRFLLKELSLMSAGVIFPCYSAVFGGSYMRFGTGEYQENRVSLSVSKKPGEYVSAAIGLDYLWERLPENRKAYGVPTIEVGLTAGKPGKWLIGCHVFNPVSARLKLPWGKETVPWSVRVGNTWYAASWLMLCTEISVIRDKPVEYHTGLEFSPCPPVSVRVGISGRPLQISTGLGFTTGPVKIDISFSHHGFLGFTPGTTITYTP